MLTASEIAELDRRIAVMQAFREGKRIQRCFVGETDWQDEPNPHWNWPNSHYRIAPEPRKPRDFWLQWDVDGQLIARTAPATQFGEVLHVREVLPD